MIKSQVLFVWVNFLFAKANPLSKKLLKKLEPNSKHVVLYHTLRKTNRILYLSKLIKKSIY